MKIKIEIPKTLHPETKKLVRGFAEALAEKLHAAEKKYGYSDGWQTTEWIETGECRERLMEHIAKGDPRDVAAYCAFLWYHDASTRDEDVGSDPQTIEDLQAKRDKEIQAARDAAGTLDAD